MIRILLLTFCFFSVQSNEPVRNWSESYKLSWKDFEGNPDNNSGAAATTASGIIFGYSMQETNTEVVSFTTEIHAQFYPEKSWFKPKLATIYLLAHEQLHFDITELHARKFRYEVSLLKVSKTIKNDLKALNKKINKQLALMQQAYDGETSHSRNKEAQVKWNAYIAKELQKLEQYKSVD